MEIKKCYKCGGKMERNYASWICLRCYCKVTLEDVMKEYERRDKEVFALIAELDPAHNSKPETLFNIIMAKIHEPFYWETEGEPDAITEEVIKAKMGEEFMEDDDAM